MQVVEEIGMCIKLFSSWIALAPAPAPAPRATVSTAVPTATALYQGRFLRARATSAGLVMGAMWTRAVTLMPLHVVLLATALTRALNILLELPIALAFRTVVTQCY